MKYLVNISVIMVTIVSCACMRQAASRIIKTFGSGINYELLTDINNGTRVISLQDPTSPQSSDIIIQGDVLWCELRVGHIVGEKAANALPASWMDPNWRRNGFFILNPAAIDSGGGRSDELRFGKAIEWFETRDNFERALAALVPTSKQDQR
ncbi:MAG: hypothetical protein JNN07_19495 [Verrucomicrobiales bacterium]|nr:hypothetical protein [Verrucomicrobiales bacterium]